MPLVHAKGAGRDERGGHPEVLQGNKRAVKPARLCSQQRRHVLLKVLGRGFPAGRARRGAAQAMSVRGAMATPHRWPAADAAVDLLYTRGQADKHKARRGPGPVAALAHVGEGMVFGCLCLSCLPARHSSMATARRHSRHSRHSEAPPVRLHLALQLRPAQQLQLGSAPEERQVLAALQRLEIAIPAGAHAPAGDRWGRRQQ